MRELAVCGGVRGYCDDTEAQCHRGRRAVDGPGRRIGKAADVCPYRHLMRAAHRAQRPGGNNVRVIDAGGLLRTVRWSEHAKAAGALSPGDGKSGDLRPACTWRARTVPRIATLNTHLMATSQAVSLDIADHPT
jgi:hypothetical protein